MKTYKGYTLEEARKELDKVRQARDRVLEAQSYSLGSRSVTRASLSELNQMVEYWEEVVDALEGNVRGRTKRAVLVDG